MIGFFVANILPWIYLPIGVTTAHFSAKALVKSEHITKWDWDHDKELVVIILVVLTITWPAWIIYLLLRIPIQKIYCDPIDKHFGKIDQLVKDRDAWYNKALYPKADASNDEIILAAQMAEALNDSLSEDRRRYIPPASQLIKKKKPLRDQGKVNME